MDGKMQWQDEALKVDDDITLHSANERYAEPLNALVVANRDYLQQSLDWPQHVLSADDTRKTLHANYTLYHRGYAKMFMVFFREELVGVFSFNSIEPLNKTAYIGYWLVQNAQGKGIISRCIQHVIGHYSSTGEVRRFVIKCIVTNKQSNQVAQRNGFTLEGCLKQAEYLNGDWHDQHIYGYVMDQQKV